VALFKLGQETVVWPLLKHSLDPTARSYLIHRFKLLGAEAGRLMRPLNEEELDPEIRRALLLSVGELGPNVLPPSEKVSWLALVTKRYKDDPDPGTHGAAEWVLRQWGREATIQQLTAAWVNEPERREQQARIKEKLAREGNKAQPQWYVNGQGQTMVVIPGPVQFSMGSPENQDGHLSNESLHQQKVGRSFALAATPVTVGQFERFLKAYPDAQYCNWLSEQEGLDKNQWCYQPNPNPSELLALAAGTAGLLASGWGQGPLLATSALVPDRPLSGVYDEGMKLKSSYLHLHGYRLPTEAEWECACRAGTTSSYFYGESVELLEKYARYQANSAEHAWPVGGLKPNDLGLFDMSGNVSNMCLNRDAPYPQLQQGKPVEDDEDTEDIHGINNKGGRISRGGWYLAPARAVRSALRLSTMTRPFINVGFRPARTFAP
jgi:formylglycine-generating enzyme required for sulfatase activity